MAGTERTATARWSGDLMKGSGTVHLDSSGHEPELPVTWASRTESPGGKTSPEELIAAAHAACFSMALSHGLAGDGHPPTSLTTVATSSFERTSEGMRITRMNLRVRGTVEGLDGDGFIAAARKAKEGCPVSNALKGNVEIELDAALES
jgi:osmotically inducible protein OsmC